MSSLPPEDQPTQASDEVEDFAEDEDTGPLPARPSSRQPEPEWVGAPVPPSWQGRFDTPLTVSPRPVRTRRDSKKILGAVGAVVAVAAVGGLVFWLLRPSASDDPPAAEPAPAEPSGPESSATAEPAVNSQDQERLMRVLPRGYPPGSCKPESPPEGALAQVSCTRNTDPDGPLSGTYTLVSDRKALEAVFANTMSSATRVNCPGNIQSPGPWRRNATPQIISGTLYCGLRDGQPIVAWTDDARLTLNAVTSGPGGPTFPALYTWWSSHS